MLPDCMGNSIGFLQSVRVAITGGATATKKTVFIIIIEKLLRHILGLVGDDRVQFVKFDGARDS